MTSTQNEVASIFREDSRTKKNIAHSASRRVGKRKGCKLPARTAAEMKKLNGPCVTYRLDDPMNWTQFTQLPLNIQQEYVGNLARKFRVNQNKLCDLFGAKQEAIATYFDNKSLSTLYAKTIAAAGPDAEPDLAGWNQFVNSLWRPKAEPEQMDDIMEKVATGLLAMREKLGISQEKLADLLGCSRVAVSRGERQVCSKAYAANLWALMCVYEKKGRKAAVKPVAPDAPVKAQDADERKDLAMKLRDLRTMAKMTQQEVADMLQCSIATVSRAEHCHISVRAARQMLEALMDNCKQAARDPKLVPAEEPAESEERSLELPDMVDAVTLTGPVRDVLDGIWELFGESGDTITVAVARKCEIQA